MLAGLSKWPILRIPPCFCADTVPMDSNSALAVASTRRSRFISSASCSERGPKRAALPLCRPFLGSRAGGNIREVITYRIRGTGARYPRSIALLLARLAGKGCLSSQRSPKRESHSRAFRQLMSLKVESADLESPDLAPSVTAWAHTAFPELRAEELLALALRSISTCSPRSDPAPTSLRSLAGSHRGLGQSIASNTRPKPPLVDDPKRLLTLHRAGQAQR